MPTHSNGPAYTQRIRKAAVGLMAVCLLVASSAAPLRAQAAANSEAPKNAAPQAEKHISAEEVKKLFALVDELMKFASDDTGLEVRSSVKRQLRTREDVEKFMRVRLAEDKSAQRMERDEIVLKKFGYLDRDFNLKPFLLDLLKEQVAGYYDEKTRTVNLLDWLGVELQKPVMAHELTHALQDQRVNISKWSEQTLQDESSSSASDTEHLRRDEWDTAREAVAEGQATAVMTDYILKPMGKSVVGDPEVVEMMRQQMTGTGDDSPVMARAPLLLTESMLFPYRDGLSFEQDVWMDQGKQAAFGGMLDSPPTSSWEVLNPREYEHHRMPPVPLLPDIHPLVDTLYRPYDIGQIGQLDLRILVQLLGGEPAARRLAPAWNGGIYWAGQLKSAQSAAERASTASLAYFYLSVWRNASTATAFAHLYGENLDRKYQGVKAEPLVEKDGEERQVFATSEGLVMITQRGATVMIAESFPRATAAALTARVLDAQATGAPQMAMAERPGEMRQPLPTLSGDLVRVFAHCGVLKAVVQAANTLQPAH